MINLRKIGWQIQKGVDTFFDNVETNKALFILVLLLSFLLYNLFKI